MLSDRPTHQSSADSLPVLKLHPGADVTLSIQSDHALYLGVHWVDRQIVCAGDECPLCAYEPSTSRAFLLALVEHQKRWRPVMLDATPAVLARLDGLADGDRCVFRPGLRVQASRRKRTSPLRLDPLDNQGVVEAQYSGLTRLLRAIACLYRLPAPFSDETWQDWVCRVHPTVVHRAQSVIPA